MLATTTSTQPVTVAPATRPAPAPSVTAATRVPATRPVVASRPASPATGVASGGCAAALAYLAAHAAPGFKLECPGNAYGHQAITCVNIPGMCPGFKLIAIAVPCPASWMNEASNSWILTGLSSGRLDQYGHC